MLLMILFLHSAVANAQSQSVYRVLEYRTSGEMMPKKASKSKYIAAPLFKEGGLLVFDTRYDLPLKSTLKLIDDKIRTLDFRGPAEFEFKKNGDSDLLEIQFGEIRVHSLKNNNLVLMFPKLSTGKFLMGESRLLFNINTMILGSCFEGYLVFDDKGQKSVISAGMSFKVDKKISTGKIHPEDWNTWSDPLTEMDDQGKIVDPISNLGKRHDGFGPNTLEGSPKPTSQAEFNSTIMNDINPKNQFDSTGGALGPARRETSVQQ